MDYGAVRTYMGGQVIVLSASEQKTGINIQLPQLAVLTGSVRERVDPVEVVAGQDQTLTPKFFTSADIAKFALAYLRGETR